MLRKLSADFVVVFIFLSVLFSISYGYAFFDQNSSDESIGINIGEWIYEEIKNLRFLFANEKLDDFLFTSIWHESKDGFRSGFGLLYVENPFDEYTIVARAVLGIEQSNQSVAGGFGILFETSIDEKLLDTGYVLQVDRGYGGIVIRPRTSGNEGSIIIAITNQQNKYIPVSKRDPFWTEEKSVTIQIKPVDLSKTQKFVNVWIDDVLIIEDLIIISSTEHQNNFTGFRSWNTVTEYRELEIIPSG